MKAIVSVSVYDGKLTSEQKKKRVELFWILTDEKGEVELIFNILRQFIEHVTILLCYEHVTTYHSKP